MVEIEIRGSRNHHVKTDQASLIKVLFRFFGCFRKKNVLTVLEAISAASNESSEELAVLCLSSLAVESR